MNIYENRNFEFESIVNDILNNDEFKSLKKVSHHGLNRFDHSYRVAINSYKISKALKLDYISTARAGLLHDFFYENEETYSNKREQFRVLNNHPSYALKQAKKYFKINKKEADIIETHMFPFGKKVPKYLESWIVDIVDDIVSAVEKCYSVRYSMKAASTFVLCLIMNSK